MKLVIVESPAKAKTINKYLGKDYQVLASFGHIRDLPAKDGSVLPDKDFEMTWAVEGKGEKHEEKVRMLINMSHELRTPLTLIMAPLKRLLGRKTDDSEDSAILHRIYRQSKRMKDLLDMVLDLRKMEVGKSGLSISRAF